MVMHHTTCRRFRSDRLAPKCAANRAYWRMAFPRLALRICGQFLRHHIAHTQSCYDRLVHPSCWLPPASDIQCRREEFYGACTWIPSSQHSPSDVLASRRCTMAVLDTSRLVVSSDVDHTASGLGADKSGTRRGRGRPWVGSLSDATSPEITM